MRMQVILDSTLRTLFSPARVQPLYGAGRKESLGTGLDQSERAQGHIHITNLNKTILLDQRFFSLVEKSQSSNPVFRVIFPLRYGRTSLLKGHATLGLHSGTVPLVNSHSKGRYLLPIVRNSHVPCVRRSEL